MQKLSFCIAFYKSLIARKIERRLGTFFVAFSVRPLCPVVPLPAKGNGKTEGFLDSSSLPDCFFTPSDAEREIQTIRWEEKCR